MKPIDSMPAFKPKREATQLPDGSWLVKVTPPSFMSLPGSKLTLTEDQYERYVAWQENGNLIQNMLPELSDDDREILLTGLGPQEFADACEDDEE
jgi:hypothetical protein